MRAVVATLARDDRARALLEQVYRYVLSTAPPDVDVGEIRTMLLEVAGPEGEEDVMNAAEQLIAEPQLPQAARKSTSSSTTTASTRRTRLAAFSTRSEAASFCTPSRRTVPMPIASSASGRTSMPTSPATTAARR